MAAETAKTKKDPETKGTVKAEVKKTKKAASEKQDAGKVRVELSSAQKTKAEAETVKPKSERNDEPAKEKTQAKTQEKTQEIKQMRQNKVVHVTEELPVYLL